ncbi:hypothetical protein lerEdw1_020500 [Lerista edwardsae]|nr:hypothetical protein lerEdw1_020500 [Lerista edwardsae]
MAIISSFFNHGTRMAPSLSSTVSYTDPTLEPIATEHSAEDQKIIDSQFKCYERMNREPPYERAGLFCNRTWDGWLCWDDTPAGKLADQNCPDYFPDFDPTGRANDISCTFEFTEIATKYCDETGTWFRHPESNRTWSNYTRCNSFTNEKQKGLHFDLALAFTLHSKVEKSNQIHPSWSLISLQSL